MFKKFLYGTLLAALATVVGVGGCVGITLFQIQNLVTQVRDLQAQYQRTNKEYARPAEAGVEWPTEAGLETFLAIRAEVGTKLDENLGAIRTELQAKDEELDRGPEGGGGRLGFLELMDLIRSQFTRLDEVGRRHVELLDHHQMAASDYQRYTHLLMITLARSAGEEAPEELSAFRSMWRAYEEPSETFSPLLSRTRSGAEKALDLEELRERLAAEDMQTTEAVRMSAMLRTLPRGGADRLDAPGAPLLDLIVDQYDPAALVEP